VTYQVRLAVRDALNAPHQLVLSAAPGSWCCQTCVRTFSGRRIAWAGGRCPNELLEVVAWPG
jgi:hypothetical protein